MELLLLVYQVPYIDPLVMTSVIGVTSVTTFAVTRVYDFVMTKKKDKSD